MFTLWHTRNWQSPVPFGLQVLLRQLRRYHTPLGTTLEKYQISTTWSHAHITPFLYHQSKPFAWPMVILNQSSVSATVPLSVLNNINAPTPSPAPSLNCDPKMYRVVALWLTFVQNLFLYKNAPNAGNMYFGSRGLKGIIFPSA